MRNSGPAKFLSRWFLTIAFVVLFSTQAIVALRLVQQNEDIRQIVETQQIVDCLTRQDSRESLRGIFSAVFDAFPESAEVEALRSYMDNTYPPILCPDGK